MSSNQWLHLTAALALSLSTSVMQGRATATAMVTKSMLTGTTMIAAEIGKSGTTIVSTTANCMIGTKAIATTCRQGWQSVMNCLQGWSVS